jgi:prolyl-tRNA synthetase
MNAKVTGNDGKDIYPQMGSYGIGVSRLVAAIIESSHDENGIIWPDSVAPFKAVVINVKIGNEDSDRECEKLYEQLKQNNIDALYDDRKVGLGQKFAVADLIGVPKQIVIGPNSIKNGKAEIKDRKTGEKTEVDLDKILNYLTASK